MSKIHANPEHLRRSGTKLGNFGGKLADGGQKLNSAGQRLLSHASGDRSGIGRVISKAFGKGVQITGTVFGEGGRVAEGAGKRLHTTADLHEQADEHGAGVLKKLHPDTKEDIDPDGRQAPRRRTKASVLKDHDSHAEQQLQLWQQFGTPKRTASGSTGITHRLMCTRDSSRGLRSMTPSSAADGHHRMLNLISSLLNCPRGATRTADLSSARR